MKYAVREYLPDGALLLIHADGNWRFTTADRKRHNGKAATVPAAKDAAMAIYRDSVFARWMRGTNLGDKGFLCPLI